MRKIIFSLVVLSLSLLFPVNDVRADITGVDQMCNSFSDAVRININDQTAWQLFAPTKNTLDEISFPIFSLQESPVKIKIRIWDLTSPERRSQLVEKNVAVDTVNGWKSYDFGGISMPLGIYGITITTLHDQDVVWLATHYPCYPPGSAVIDGQFHEELDFGFAVYAHDTITSSVDQTLPADTDSSNQTDSVSDSTGSNADQPAVSSTVNDSAVIDTSVANPEITDTANTNKVNDYGKKLMTDEETQELIAWILADAEANRSHGIFGLSGVMGSILTWPVIIGVGIICLLLIIIIVVIVVLRKRKNRSSSVPVEPIKP